jgi:hypothetical protein
MALVPRLIVSAFFLFSALAAGVGQSARDEAAQLLLRAENAGLQLSNDRSSPYHERVMFTLVGTPPGDLKGQIIKDYLSSSEWRERSELGDYKRVTVRSGQQLGEFRSAAFEPLWMEPLRRSLPPVVMHLDGTERIKKITTRTISGVANKCIEYETRKEGNRQENELCINEAAGTLTILRERILEGACVLGCKTETEWSDYKPFNGKLYPRHVRITKYRFIDADVEFSSGSDLTPSSFRIPRNLEVRKACDTTSPPTRLNGELPNYPHRMNEWLFEGSVVVQARIGVDGRVQEAQIANQHSQVQGITGVTPGIDGRDLDAAVLDAVRKWVFEPAKCDGAPMVENTLITFRAEIR